jgi:hypothetical protein
MGMTPTRHGPLQSQPQGAAKTQISTRFVFAIPLKPKAVASKWEAVSRYLGQTLRSVFASAEENFLVVICGHERPDIAEMNDQRVIFLEAPFPHQSNVKSGVADKARKLRHIGIFLRSSGYGQFYLMFLDADDLVHRELVSFVLTTDNRRGYLLGNGYQYDTACRRLLLQAECFDRNCGSCFVGWFENADLPRNEQDRSSYFSTLVRHTTRGLEAEKAGRPADAVPFPAAVHVFNHDESLERARRDGQIRVLSSHRAVPIRGRSARQILRQEFALDDDRSPPNNAVELLRRVLGFRHRS